MADSDSICAALPGSTNTPSKKAQQIAIVASCLQATLFGAFLAIYLATVRVRTIQLPEDGARPTTASARRHRLITLMLCLSILNVLFGLMWLYEASFGWGIVVGLFPFLGFVFTCFTQGLLSMGFMIYRTLELWDRLGPSKLRSSLLLASVPYIALLVTVSLLGIFSKDPFDWGLTLGGGLIIGTMLACSILIGIRFHRLQQPLLSSSFLVETMVLGPLVGIAALSSSWLCLAVGMPISGQLIPHVLGICATLLKQRISKHLDVVHDVVVPVEPSESSLAQPDSRPEAGTPLDPGQ